MANKKGDNCMKLDNCIAKGDSKRVYVDGDKAIKLFGKGYSKSDVLYEALNTTRVEDTGLDIPKVLSVSVDDSKWSITSEYVEGKTVAELIKEDSHNADAYIEKMVDYQIEIHSKKNPLLVKLKDKLSRQINSLNELDSTTKYELLTRLESMPKHNKLCHGDFCPENIIVTSSGNLKAVDWVHATQGNASADAARTYLLLALNSQQLADSYLYYFCEKSCTSKPYVQQWLPIVAAAQLEKRKPEEKELLEKWLNVVDFE